MRHAGVPESAIGCSGRLAVVTVRPAGLMTMSPCLILDKEEELKRQESENDDNST